MYKYLQGKVITLFMLTIIVSNSTAQEITKKNGAAINNRFGFNMGYFGYKLYNPGVQLGFENYVATTNNYNVLGGLNTFYYNQNDIQSAIAISARIGQRYTAKFGLFLESYFGIGFQQTFYLNKTFVYNSGQSMITENKMSKTGFSPSIALGLGYDFSKQTEFPIKFYLRPSFYWLYPDRNLVFQSSYAIETGLIYVPNFMKKINKGTS